MAGFGYRRTPGSDLGVTMARMVLVHGAFAGGWCWDPVVPGLEAAGHVVEAIDLPGAGADRTPVEEIDLRRYADRVVTQLVEATSRRSWSATAWAAW
jgi:alpha-beta hydrolase superfamily lysophospholipase